MFKDTQVFSGFSVNDITAAADFYGNTLGITVKETPEGLFLEFAGGVKIFAYPKDNHTPATFTILNFKVDDIDTAVADLAAKGIKLEHYPGMPQDEKGVLRGLAANQGPDIAWFKDPAGNILSVLQEG